MNNNIIAIILIFLSFFLVFLNIGIVKFLLFFIIFLLFLLVIKTSDKFESQKKIFDKEIKEIRKKNEKKIVNEVEKDLLIEEECKEKMKELQCLNDSLERINRETKRDLEIKTKQFEEKIDELEQFSNIFVDRENKMMELKNKIKELEYNK
jgi:Ca2+/Na+ antiporter